MKKNILFVLSSIILVSFLLVGCTNDTPYTEEKRESKKVNLTEIIENSVYNFGWQNGEGIFRVTQEEFEKRLYSMAEELGWEMLDSGYKDRYNFTTSDGAKIELELLIHDGINALDFRKNDDIKGNEERNNYKIILMRLLLGDDSIKGYSDEITSTPSCQITEDVRSIKIRAERKESCNDRVVKIFKQNEHTNISLYATDFRSKLLYQDSKTGKFNVMLTARYGNDIVDWLIWFEPDFTLSTSTDKYRFKSIEYDYTGYDCTTHAKSSEWRDAFEWQSE